MKNKSILLFSTLFAWILFGCKSSQTLSVNDNTKNTESDYRSHLKDSVTIYQRDSIFMLVKGDTVIMQYFKTEYRNHWRERIDTLHLRDSVLTKQTQYINVKNPSTAWQNFQLWCGRILLLLVLIFIALTTVKRNFKPI